MKRSFLDGIGKIIRKKGNNLQKTSQIYKRRYPFRTNVSLQIWLMSYSLRTLTIFATMYLTNRKVVLKCTLSKTNRN